MNQTSLGLPCSLITPLKNERDNVARLWTSIHEQTLLPAEWIITDNGSTDGTYEWLLQHAPESPFPVRVLMLPGMNIAKMMNTAVLEAERDIIAVCHGGTRIPSNWLENLLRPMTETPSIEVVAGLWEPYGENAFERWVSSTMSVDIERLDERTYLPASRSIAFKKTAWKKVDGFPEWLPRFGEDTLFAIRLRAGGCKFAIAREAKVGWRPKPTLAKHLRQFYLYAEADSCMGFLPFRMSFLLPFGFISTAALLGYVMKNPVIALATLATLTIGEYIAIPFITQRRRYSFSAYFFWRWLTNFASLAGFLRGKALIFRDNIAPPFSDVESIQKHRSLLPKFKQW